MKEQLLKEIAFNENGLVAAIAQQFDTKEVLMMAWMDKEAVEQTLSSGEAHYFSRSRNKQWKKGESSGQTQKIIEIQIDCDGDTVLLLVDQKGVACHTGRRQCFFRTVKKGELEINQPVITDPDTLYKK